VACGELGLLGFSGCWDSQVSEFLQSGFWGSAFCVLQSLSAAPPGGGRGVIPPTDCLTAAPTLMGLIGKLRASLLPIRFMHSSLQF
jgi:hypothetical protein